MRPNSRPISTLGLGLLLLALSPATAADLAPLDSHEEDVRAVRVRDVSSEIDRYKAESVLMQRSLLAGTPMPGTLSDYLVWDKGGQSDATNTAPCTVPVAPTDLCPPSNRNYTVCPSGCNYSNIQTAINSVPLGSNIRVLRRPTAYEPYQVGNLLVNRRVNLIAEDVGEREWVVRLQTAATGYGIHITADSACLRGFRIDHMSANPAIRIVGSTTAARRLVKVARNAIDTTNDPAPQGATGIELFGTDGSTLLENRIIGDKDNMGIHFEGDLGNKNNVVWSNVISGYSRGIVLNAGAFTSYSLPMSFNTIAWNHIRHASDGIFSWSMSLGGFGTANVADNLYYMNTITEPAGSDASGVWLLGTSRERVCSQTISGPWIGVAMDSSGFAPVSDANKVSDCFIRASHWAIAVGPGSNNGVFQVNNLATSRVAGSYNAAWAFIQNGGSHTIAAGEGHSNECWMYFDQTPSPRITMTNDPREIDNDFELCIN